MSEREQRVSNLTPESVDRLYWANDLKNYINERSEFLKKLGVVEVVLFGSVVRGNAGISSDLDVLFVLLPDSQDISEPMLPKYQRVKSSFDMIDSFIKFKEIGLLPPYGEKPIHLIADFSTLEEGHYPSFASDRVILWSASK